MAARDPNLAPNASAGLQWSSGGWFGGQIGSTLWMLILAGVLFAVDMTSALVSLAAFVVCNVLGVALWRRRDTRSAHWSIQVLMAVTGAASLVVFILVNSAVSRGAVLPRFMGVSHLPYWVLLVFPLIMGQLHVQHWLGQRAADPQQA